MLPRAWMSGQPDQSETHTIIILMTRKPAKDRATGIDTRLFHTYSIFRRRQVHEDVHRYGCVPQIPCHHCSLGALARKGSPCFLWKSVCGSPMCDSSILWAPPMAGATPMQDLSVGLQRSCMWGWLAVGTRAGPSLDASAWESAIRVYTGCSELHEPSLLISCKIPWRKATDPWGCQGVGRLGQWLCCRLATVSTPTTSFSFQWLPSERNFRDEQPIMILQLRGFVMWGLITYAVNK